MSIVFRDLGKFSPFLLNNDQALIYLITLLLINWFRFICDGFIVILGILLTTKYKFLEFIISQNITCYIQILSSTTICSTVLPRSYPALWRKEEYQGNHKKG